MNSNSQNQEIFDQIIKYYDYAKELIGLIENNKIPEEYLEKTGQLIHTIETLADALTTEFIDQVQNGSSFESEENFALIFEQIETAITELENRINHV